MSKRDEQLDDELKRMLSDIDIPPPDETAKKRALAMARTEFELMQGQGEQNISKRSQGLLGWLRLIVGSEPDNGRAIMPFNRKLMYSGVAAVAVGAVAVGITYQNQPYSTTPPSIVLREPQVDRTEVPVGIAEVKERRPNTGKVALPSKVATLSDGKNEVGERQATADSPPLHALEEAIVTAVRSRDDEIYMENVASRNQVPNPTASTGKRDLPKTARRSNLALEEKIVAARRGSESIQDTPVDVTRFAAAPPLDQRMAVVVPPRSDSDVMPQSQYKDLGRDKFEEFEQNPVKLVAEEPVSTFSVDVDTASYSFIRRQLNSGVLPQGDAVRAEELINYFDYDYPLPESQAQPFRPTVLVTDAPWAEGRKLMHIGIKGYDIAPEQKPRSNLVFLLDVSGSMNSPDKLPLVKQSMEMLLTSLNPEDTVAIAVYAGAAGMVLEPTPVKEKQKILNAMHQLNAGGSTAGAQGIRLAYELAEAEFDKSAVNRVILATDGDFNVGITNQRELQSFIERKRDKGIFLSVLGFGQGNYQDALMQTLAQNGNGVAAYIDTLSEAQKVLVEESTSTLFPIAKDVKIQVEFNPATVAEYRLIGYETRHLNREDFNNDAVDAGDIGAGHTVTAIYEFTPQGSPYRQIEDSRYTREESVGSDRVGEYAFVKIRYKLPEEDTSKLISRPVTRETTADSVGKGIAVDADFATAVAGFAQLLKGGKYTGDYTYDDVIELAQRSRGSDPYGYRSEFVQLVRKAKTAREMQRR